MNKSVFGNNPLSGPHGCWPFGSSLPSINDGASLKYLDCLKQQYAGIIRPLFETDEERNSRYDMKGLW